MVKVDVVNESLKRIVNRLLHFCCVGREVIFAFAKHRSTHSHGGKRMRTNCFRNKTMWRDAVCVCNPKMLSLYWESSVRIER